VKSGKREEGRGKREEERGERQKKQLRDLRKSIEICPPTPNSGGDRDQSPPELGDLGGECISPKLKTQNSKLFIFLSPFAIHHSSLPSRLIL